MQTGMARCWSKAPSSRVCPSPELSQGRRAAPRRPGPCTSHLVPRKLPGTQCKQSQVGWPRAQARASRVRAAVAPAESHEFWVSKRLHAFVISVIFCTSAAFFRSFSVAFRCISSIFFAQLSIMPPPSPSQKPDMLPQRATAVVARGLFVLVFVFVCSRVILRLQQRTQGGSRRNMRLPPCRPSVTFPARRSRPAPPGAYARSSEPSVHLKTNAS